jgi:CBS domain-containing protein
MKISDVMTTDVETVSADDTAQDAAKFMLRAEAGSIPVCDGDKVIGMITDRDIAVRGVAEGRGPDTPIRDQMTDGIVSLGDLSRQTDGQSANKALEGVSERGGRHEQ